MRINTKINLSRIIIKALKKQIHSEEYKVKKYIPNPSTWLNQGRWEDELTYDEDTNSQYQRLKEQGKI